MAAAVEPSQPQERAARDLAPKSYADAAAEPPDSSGNDVVHFKRPLTPVQVNGNYQNGTADKEEYNGTGLDDSPRSPIRGHKRKVSKSKTNGIKKGQNDSEEQHVTFEKFEDHKGQRLTSMKPSDDYEEQLRQDRKEKPGKEQLVSGRRAGAGWARSKIRWAPLNVPLQRRLQTFVVLMHTLSMVGSVGIFFLLCVIPLLWPILIPYLIYVSFSNAGSNGELKNRNERMRSSKIWSLFASYFPARLHRSQELLPTRKYVFGYHPHGIISHGAFAAFATEALGFGQLFPGITNSLLTLDSNFRLPLYREYALRMGLASVSQESIKNILTKGGPNGEGMGRAVTVVVGGARESLDARPNTMRLVLARRKGFVKLAVKTGADLVPVLAFGESDLYEQVDAQAHPWIHQWQLFVKKVAGFTVPLFHARGVFNYDVGMMPYRRPLNIVVGRPISVIQQQEPDFNYVNQLHEEYVNELKRIWEEWKDTFAKDRKEELEIVE